MAVLDVIFDVYDYCQTTLPLLYGLCPWRKSWRNSQSDLRHAQSPKGNSSRKGGARNRQRKPLRVPSVAIHRSEPQDKAISPRFSNFVFVTDRHSSKRLRTAPPASIEDFLNAETRYQEMVSVARSRHHNDSEIPVSKLSDELLRMVFVHYVAASRDADAPGGTVPHDKANGGRYSWIAIAQVCHRWRKVVLNTSALWTHIYSPPAKRHLVSLQVRYSEPDPLHVEIRPGPKLRLLRDPFSKEARARLREVTLDLSNVPLDASPPDPAMWDCGIQVLSLKTSNPTPPHVFLNVRQNDLRRMHTLSVANLRLPKSHSLCRESVKTFTLNFGEYNRGSGCPLADVISNLGRMRNLEHLTLERATGIQACDLARGVRVYLPKLKTLKIRDRPMTVVHLLEHLSFDPFQVRIDLTLDIHKTFSQSTSQLGKEVVARLNRIYHNQFFKLPGIECCRLTHSNTARGITLSAHRSFKSSQSREDPDFAMTILAPNSFLQPEGPTRGFAGFFAKFPLSELKTLEASVPVWNDNPSLAWSPLLHKLGKLNQLVIRGDNVLQHLTSLLQGVVADAEHEAQKLTLGTLREVTLMGTKITMPDMEAFVNAKKGFYFGLRFEQCQVDEDLFSCARLGSSPFRCLPDRRNSYYCQFF